MTQPIASISIIGSGNVATHLAEALHLSGFQILEVHSRTFEHASTLARAVKAEPIKNIDELSDTADLFIFSIKDDVYSETLKKFPHSNILVAHTAGSLSINILKSASNQYGVLYPFQTFSKEKKTCFHSIPILVSGNNESVLKKIQFVANKLSNTVSLANDEQRKRLHIAAVFACNFVNHMYATAKEITDAGDIDFSLLFPLIQETASKAQLGNPATTQTGPAIRGDQKIINNHIDLLKDSPEIQNIYKILSLRISSNHA